MKNAMLSIELEGTLKGATLKVFNRSEGIEYVLINIPGIKQLVRFDEDAMDSLLSAAGVKIPANPEVKIERAGEDMVNHPKHYAVHPSGVECIELSELMSFCIGNAFKYIWRAGNKIDAKEDLYKAIWYLDRHLTKSGLNIDCVGLEDHIYGDMTDGTPENIEKLVKVVTSESKLKGEALTLIYCGYYIKAKKKIQEMIEKLII